MLASVGLAVSTFLVASEKRKAEHNARNAEQNRRDAQQAVDRLGSQFAERLADIPGAAPVRRAMLHETLAYYQRFAEQAQDDPTLQSDLALTYSKIGTLTDEIGSTSEAIRAHQQAITLWQRLAAAEPNTLEHQRRLASSKNNLALALRRAGRMAEARQANLEAIDLQTELVRRSFDESLLGELAVSHGNLGLLLCETGKGGEAERCFREAIRLQEQLVRAAPADAQRRLNLAVTYNNLSSLFVDSDVEQARDCYESALGQLRQAVALEPGQADIVRKLASTQNNLASLQSRQGAYQEAANSYEEAIRSQRILVDSAPNHNGHRRDLAVTLNNFGLAQSRLQKSGQAEQAFRESLAIHQALVAFNADDVALRSSSGGVHNNLGIVLEEQQQLTGAAAAYRDAIAEQQFAHSRASTVARYRLFLSKHYFNLGRVLRRLNEPEQAIDVALQRRALWTTDPQRLFSVAEELAQLASLLPDTERVAALVTETLEQAIAAGGQPPTDFGKREAFDNLKTDQRLAKLLGG
jgi:hypothetical protein